MSPRTRAQKAPQTHVRLGPLRDLLQQVIWNQQDEVHTTHQESMHWCRQWRHLAEQFAACAADLAQSRRARTGVMAARVAAEPGQQLPAQMIAELRAAVAHGAGHDCEEWWDQGNCCILCDRTRPQHDTAADRPDPPPPVHSRRRR